MRFVFFFFLGDQKCQLIETPPPNILAPLIASMLSILCDNDVMDVLLIFENFGQRLFQILCTYLDFYGNNAAQGHPIFSPTWVAMQLLLDKINVQSIS